MTNSPIQHSAEQEENIQIGQIAKLAYTILLNKWKYFLLSFICCVAIGWIYLERQPRIYQRQAVMLIEDAETSSFGGAPTRRSRGNMGTLLELNGISVGNILKDEMFIITSYRLMTKVVDSLGLDVDYAMANGLHKVSLYKNLPFSVEFSEKEALEPTSFDVDTKDGFTYELTDFNVGKDSHDTLITAEVGKWVATPAGQLRIQAKRPMKTFLEDPRTITISHWPLEVAAAIYHGKVSATEYDKESSLIVLNCNDQNQLRAEEVLNEMFEAYKRDVVENKNRVAQSTAKFIDERILLIGSDLSEIEANLASFKQSNKIVDFKQNAQIFVTETSQAHQRTMQLETELAVAEYLLDFVRNHSDSEEVIPVLSFSGGDFSQPISDYNKLLLERGRYLENTHEKSATVAEVDRKLTALRNSIIASVESYMTSLKLQVREARSNEAMIAGKVGNVPEKEKQALSIERQQTLKANLYNYLLNKREEVALQLAINEANVRLVEHPMGNKYPISPKKSIIIFISLVMGIAIPYFVIWLMRIFDTTVANRKDLEDVVSIPVVAEIPKWAEASGNRLIADCNPEAPIIEAFRMLRYGLKFINASAKVFVVSSSTPGQGKSFISQNLAFIFSMTGKRVLLIDADIRKRNLTKKYGSTEGLTGYLVNEDKDLSLQSVVIANGVCKNVDFLPAGVLPPNPSEILMSERFDQLVEKAREIYDYVIIDTTPMFLVADAGIVSRVTDVTIFAVRVGVQDKNFLPELEKLYQSKRFNRLTVVLNGGDAKTQNYGYGYGYGKDIKHGRGLKKS